MRKYIFGALMCLTALSGCSECKSDSDCESGQYCKKKDGAGAEEKGQCTSIKDAAVGGDAGVVDASAGAPDSGGGGDMPAQCDFSGFNEEGRVTRVNPVLSHGEAGWRLQYTVPATLERFVYDLNVVQDDAQFLVLSGAGHRVQMRFTAPNHVLNQVSVFLNSMDPAMRNVYVLDIPAHQGARVSMALGLAQPIQLPHVEYNDLGGPTWLALAADAVNGIRISYTDERCGNVDPD